MDSSLVLNFMLTNDGNTLLAVRSNNGSLQLSTTPITILQDNCCDPQEFFKNIKNDFILNNLHSPSNSIESELIDVESVVEKKNNELQLQNSSDNKVGNNENYKIKSTQQFIATTISPDKNQELKKTETDWQSTSDNCKNDYLSEKKDSKKVGRPKKLNQTSCEKALLKCNICSQEFKTNSLMQKHMHDHVQEKSYHCPKCSASFNVPVNFTLHMATHNVGEPKCPECGRKFARLASLKAHMLKHQVDENLYCPECEDTFQTKMQLEAHLKLHNEKWSNNESKKCKLCNKKFTQPFLYRRHLREHYKTQIKSIKQTKRGSIHRNSYKCKICLKVFEKPSQLTRHLPVHTGEKPFKCALCDRRFTQKSSVRIHMWQHSGVKPYNCSLCNAKFTQKGNLEAHIRRVHKLQEVNKIPLYRCGKCACVFKKLGSLNIHVKRMHINDTEANENSGKNDKDKRKIGTDVKSREKVVQDKDDNLKNKKPEKELSQNSDNGLEVNQDDDESSFVILSDKTTGQKEGKYIKVKQRLINNVRFYDCSYCSKQFKKPSDLMRHLRIHTQEKPFRCEICDRTFKLKSTILDHQKTHSKFSCLECDMVFSSEKLFQVHNTKHHVSNFNCAICKASFTTFDEIKAHSTVHHPPNKKQKKELPPEVEKIELSEPLVLTELSNGLLSVQPKHRNDLTHGKGRPHKCTVCPAAFMKVSHLKQHNRRHTGEKPFTCSECDRKFTTKSSLKAHYRTHDLLKPFSCPICDMKFSTLSSMKRHHITHNSKRPYMCPYCHKTFKSAVNCRKHMKKHKVEIAEQQNKKNQQESSKLVLDHIDSIEKEFNLVETINYNNSYNAATDKLHNNETSAVTLSENIFNEPVTSEILEEDNQSINKNLMSIINIELNNDRKQEVESILPVENRDQSVLNLIYNDGLPLLSPMITTPEANIISQLSHFDFDQMKLLNINDINLEILSAASTNFSNVFDFDKTSKSSDNPEKFEIKQKETLSEETNEMINKNFDAKKKEKTPSCDKENAIDEEMDVIQDTHKCYECNQEFTTSLKLRDHIKEHVKYELQLKHSLGPDDIIIDEKKDKSNSGNKNKKCTYCSKVFRKPSDLVRHIRTHSGERPFECPICDKRFAVKCTLDSHLKIHTGEKPYSCHVCSFALSTKSSLRNHMLTHNGAKPFKCPMCDMKFRTVGQRKVHILSHMQEPAMSEPTERENSIERSSSQNVSTSPFKKKNIQLSKLDISKNKTELKSTQAVTESTNISEDGLAISLENEADFLNLVESSQLVSSLEFNYLLDNGLITIQVEDSEVSDQLPPTTTTSPRNNCDSETNSMESNVTSKVIHTQLDCTDHSALLRLNDVDSTMQYNNEKDNSQEIKSASNTTRRTCETCGKSFAKPCQLERHKLTHSGEKPFVCDLCQKAFSQKSSLQLHRKRHTGDRPYTCVHCGHNFTQKGNLRIHVARMHNLKVTSIKRRNTRSQRPTIDQAKIVLKNVLEASDLPTVKLNK